MRFYTLLMGFLINLKAYKRRGINEESVKGFSVWIVLLLCIPSASAQQPKNVILLIGDGMGPDHVQAARLMAGGELAMDRLDDNPGLVNTINVWGGITDSAAAATALATGYKTENGNISMHENDVTFLRQPWNEPSCSERPRAS